MIIIDRIEGKIAILEVAGRLIDFPIEALPVGLKEGDRLELRIAAAQAFLEMAPAPDSPAAVLDALKAKFPQGPETIDL